MAGEDFYVSFGSNARKWANETLKRDLAPAHGHIKALQAALDNLESHVQRKAPMLSALQKTLQGGGGGGGGGGSRGVDLDLDRVQTVMDEMAVDFTRMKGDLAQIVTTLGKVVKGTDAYFTKQRQGESQSGREDRWRDPVRNVWTTPGAPGAVPWPAKGAAGIGAGMKLDPSTIAMLSRALHAPQNQQPLAYRMADVSKAQLDNASVDRMVRAINEVRDEVRKIGERPLAVRAEGGAPEAQATTTTTTAKPAAKTKPTQATQELDKEASLRRELLQTEVTIQAMSAVASQAGGAVEESLKKTIADLREKRDSIKAQVNKLEREETGITRSQQSARNKAAAQSAPALEQAEWDRRTRLRERLDLALNPQAFQAAVGTGRGQIRRPELVEMAQMLGKLGYQTQATTRTNVAEIVKNIVASRQAMLADYGSDVPEELRTGRKLHAPVIADEVRDMLARANISPQEAALDAADRERRRMAMLAGYVPKDATSELTHDPFARSKLLDQEDLPSRGFGLSSELRNAAEAMSQLGLASRDLSEMWTSGGSAVRVPRGMVKGGEYDDRVFGYNAATEGLRQRFLGRAGQLAQDPTFNPLKVNVGKAFAHLDDAGKQDRQAFLALRRAINEVDDLGRDFIAMADAVHELDRFVERATWRVEQAAAGNKMTDEQRRKVQTDPQEIERAQRRREELLTEMGSARFQGLGLGSHVLETPEYRAGLRERDLYRAQIKAEAEARPERVKPTYVGDAAGMAFVGGRLAPGTKDTWISNLPGARYDRYNRRFAFKDPDRDPTELLGLNKDWSSAQSAQWRLFHARQAVQRGEDPGIDIEKEARKAENKATAFLSAVERIFGISRSIEDVLGHGGQDAEGNRIPYQFINEKNAEAERKRIDKNYVARQREAESIARNKGTDEQKATASLSDAKRRLAAAIRKQEEQTAELTAMEQELEASYNALSAKDRALVAAADARLKRLQDERNALENAWHPRVDDSKMGELEQPNYREANELRKHIPNQERVVAALERQERSRRGVLTRYANTGVTGKKVAQAEERLAETTARLAAARGELAKRRVWVPDHIQAAEVAARDEAARANQFRDRNHHPGEALDVMGYPSALGYNEDARKRKARLDAELERARAARAKLVGGDGRADLVAELERRKASRADITAKIAAAREEGDLKENAGYHAAKEEQGRNEERIKAIEAKLASQGLEKYEELASQIESTNRVIASLTEQVAKAEERMQKVGAKSRTANAPDAADRTKADSAEAQELRERVKVAQDIQRKITDKRAQKKRAADAEKAGIQAEIDDLKKAPGFAQQRDIKAMRKRLFALDSAAAAGGGVGGGSEPPRTGGRGAAAPGGGGGDGSTNSILRDILTAVNGIHKTLQTGVRISGAGGGATKVDANGNPVPPKPRTYTSQTASRAELQQARSGDPRQQALAAAAQQRRLERLKESDIERAHTKAIEENARRERERTQERRRAANITATAAHEKLQLTHAESMLTAEARHELNVLRQLNRTGADNTKIAEQQARALAHVQSALARQGVAGNARNSMARSLLNDTRAPGQSPIDATSFQQINRSADALFGPMLKRSMRDAGEGGRDTLAATLFGNQGFWSRVMHSTGTFIVRNFTAGFVFGLTNALQDVIHQAIITESTFIRVSDALEQTGRSVGNLRTQLQSISADYGVALNDVYETAAGLTGIFDTTDEIAGATRVVAQLEMISDGALNAKEGMGVLASITGAYGDQLKGGVDGLEQVADVLTVIQNRLGTNVEITAEGLGSISGLANQLKIDAQDAAVYVSQIAKLTNQTGAGAGEQFGRILGSMQTGRGRAALQEALPGSGIDTLIGSGQYGEAMKVLLKNWDNLSESQQRNLTVTIAGQRQARAFAALMSNSAKVLDTAAAAHNANGEAQSRSDKIAAQLNRQIKRLQVNFQDLAQNLIRTGILNFFGLLLTVVNKTLEVVNHLLSGMNNIADSNPFLKMLKEWGAGLLGFIVTMKVVAATWRGVRASMVAASASEGVMGAGLTAMRGGSGERAMGLRDAMVVAGPAAREKLANKSADLAARAANNESKIRSAALGAEARAARLASSAAGGLGKGLSALATAGVSANIAMLGLLAAIGVAIGEWQKNKQFSEDFAKLNEQYDDQGRKLTPEDMRSRYVGPYTELRDRRIKDTEGWWGATKYATMEEPFNAIRHPIQTMKRRIGRLLDPTSSTYNNPLALSGASDALSGDTDVYDRWRGILDKKTRQTLEDLDQATRDILNEVDNGIYETGATPNTIGEMFGGALRRPGELLTKAGVLGNNKYSVKEVDKAAKDAAAKISSARQEILSSDLSDPQKNAALAELELMAKDMNDRVAAMILRARGIAEADNLSMDQIKQIDAMRPMLQQLQGTGVNLDNKDFAPGLRALIKDTGVRRGSTVGKALRRLGQGNLTRVQAMQEDSKILKEEYQNIQAKYLAALSGETTLEPDQVDEIEQQLIAKMGEIAQLTDQMIQGFIDESTTLAQAAAMRGDYAGAAAALDAGLSEIGGLRNRKQETPEVRARRDLMESQAAQQAAEYEAQGQNKRLQLSQARSMSSERDARLEVDIARNAYNALIKQREVARAAGTQGPAAEAIRQAKIAWIQAENNLATTAQAANIARMTAQVAGLWNGIAVAQGQEAIALQQYNDAVANTSANSVEAQNALAAYRNSQKSTLQTLDQVAQATRDAALAAIPPGDAVRVARQGVANARAALDAARKYGVNSTEYQGALAQLRQAQWQVNAAMAAQAQAQVGVAIALADAAGHTVQSAVLQLRQARLALAAARKNSGGALSAEVLQARAQVIQSQAAVRDARLQDDLDTINFNLEMGRMTQSSAISALREILRTRDLTKAQRRQLLLQIKGMQEELSSSPWNFGNINLPKPYLMKRYIKEQQAANTARLDAMVGQSLRASDAASDFTGQRAGATTAYNDNRTVEININGGNLAEVRRVVQEVVGRPTKTRTAASRRGRR